MKIKVLVLTILAIMTMFVPTAAIAADTQFWNGTSQVAVIETLQVLGSATGAPLTDGLVLSPITINRGETFTKSLWVKNTSTTIDYTVTPVFECTPIGVVTCVTLVTKPVAKETTVEFDFTMTGVTVGTPYTITLSFQHN